jgi:hypothetical protein
MMTCLVDKKWQFCNSECNYLEKHSTNWFLLKFSTVVGCPYLLRQNFGYCYTDVILYGRKAVLPKKIQNTCISPKKDVALQRGEAKHRKKAAT